MTKPFLFSLVCALGLTASIAHGADRELATPVFSSDAKKIAYCVVTFVESANAEDKFKIQSSEIWTANRDGSGARRLTIGAIDGNMRWSPDGKKLTFVRKSDIWMVASDGTGLKQITKTPDLTEEAPEFSNDSKTLFFIRTSFMNLAEFVPGEKPIWHERPSTIIAYSLVSGEEKERFKSENDMVQIVPNRADPGEVFLLYKLDDSLNAPLAVAAAKLDGSGRRIIKEDKKGNIKAIHAHANGIVIDTRDPVEDVNELSIQSKSGSKSLNPDKFPAMVFSAISLDGNAVMGSGPVTKEVNGKFQIQRSIKIFEPETKEFTGLDREALLGLAATPAAVPAAVTPPAKTPAVVPAKTPTVVPAPRTPPTQPAQTEKPSVKLPSTAVLAKARFDKGEANFAKEAWGEAIDDYTAAITLSPQFAAAYYKRALCYAKRYDTDLAIDDFSTAIRLAPGDVDAYLQRAEMYVLLPDNVAALADYNTAVRISPQSPKPYQARAAFYYATGDNEKAAQDEKKAKELTQP